jgi:protein-S-isoprenylcysteine O-methyltransferase Ste14
MARVPLWPVRMASQNVSRPTPNADTTPMPVIATRGCFNNMRARPYNSAVRKAFAWTGALLFLLSLLSFGYVYGWGLRVRAIASASVWRDVALNVLLFTIFALHHSVMARTGAKAWIARRVPPDLERSLYVWIASVLFLAVCWLWQPLPGAIWEASGVVFLLLFTIQMLGVLLTLRAASIVGMWELAGVRQPDHTKPIDFKASGPFAIVRHPIYLGWLLIVFATPVMTNSRLLFAAVSSAYLIAAIPWEEASLVEVFGDKYRAYQRAMPWRLIPRIW